MEKVNEKVYGKPMIERPGNVKSLKIPSRLPVLGCGSFKTESNITQVCKRKIVHGLEQPSKKAKLGTSVLPEADDNPLVSKFIPPSKAMTSSYVCDNSCRMPLSRKTSAKDIHAKDKENAKAAGNLPPSKTAVNSLVSKMSHTAALPVQSNVGKKRPAWDTKGRLEDMEQAMAINLQQNTSLQQQISSSNERIALLESMNSQLTGAIKQKEMQSDEASGEIQMLLKKIKENESDLQSIKSKWKQQVEELELVNKNLERQKSGFEDELMTVQGQCKELKSTLSQMMSSQTILETQLSSMKTSLLSSQSIICDRDKEIVSLKDAVASHVQTIFELNAKMRSDENIRRKLLNSILELKGNIRVFCRVRPFVGDELLGNDDEIPHMHFPDSESLELEKLAEINANESVASFRKAVNNKYEFTFDRVFPPSSLQTDVFDEISQLVQSSLDGYNVCIFAYGQTGSGKTYTMEGPLDSSVTEQGMIPRAVEQVFKSSDELAAKGWQYDFEVTYLEIYNETIQDLLGNNKKDVKHEIRLANPNSNEVYVTNLTINKVTTQQQTFDLLQKAALNRSVAETKCNERSSRSHSIFRLKITGQNYVTTESCSGLLNFIDLAGSERLKESAAQGQRLKETQNINKSLATLGNVIMALANKEAHVPYRNSKLTHLLQNCLGGSSKTLMFVNVSPKEDCFHETLNSLRFATKVNECNIGTAQKKLK